MPVGETRHRNEALTFSQAFGGLGAVMLVVVAIATAWTVWLICLNIAPNATANYLMDTGEFDDGDFWLLLQPEPILLVFAVLGMSIIIAMYGNVVLEMTFWRNVETRNTSLVSRAVRRINFGLHLNKSILAETWNDVTAFNGRRRKQWNTLLKAVDLTIQLMSLHRVLEYGFAPVLCFGYAALVSANALSCAIFILNPFEHSALAEVFVDTIFDMLFAVGAPIMLLAYAYTDFQFDRDHARAILENLPPGSFDRQARLAADPSEVNMFLASFDALRTNTWSGLCVQFVLNVSFCYRLKRVVQVYSVSRRRVYNSGFLERLEQARVPHPLALIFLTVSAMAIAHTYHAINQSRRLCDSYAECAAYAYRWESSLYCPCLAFISADKAPASYDIWINPPDATERLRLLTATGDLQVLYIVNRRLSVWPIELQRCKNLRHIALLYTGVETIPNWATAFSKLEFLSIEGKSSETNLVSIPDNLFNDMPVLTHLHLGVHMHLERLPGLGGLTSLNSISFAVLPSLDMVPDLSPLNHLARVQLMALPQVDILPDMPSHLSMFVVHRARVCCNGFLSQCHPTYVACSELTTATCYHSSDTTHQPSARLRALLDKHKSTICARDAALGPVSLEVSFAPIRRERVDQCRGDMYRECNLGAPNASIRRGLCYNSRMQAISCIDSQEQINLRKTEIARKIGAPCNPESTINISFGAARRSICHLISRAEPAMTVIGWQDGPETAQTDRHSHRLQTITQTVSPWKWHKFNPNAVAPVGFKRRKPAPLTFIQKFGKLGVFMLVIIGISVAWTTWLVCLNVAPTDTANYLMDTGEFDDGDFWLLLRPEPILMAFTVLGMSVIIATYVDVVLSMTIWRSAGPRTAPRQASKINFQRHFTRFHLTSATQTWTEVTGFNGRRRKQWNMVLKAVDLAIQIMSLIRVLEYGFAPVLSYGYAVLVSANALSCTVFILNPVDHSALTEVFVDSIFDMIFAVGAPIMLLMYSYMDFEFDRGRAKVILDTLRPGSYERQARLMADPIQVTTFLSSFDALRTNTWSGLCVQFILNMSFCYRLKRVVEVYGNTRERLRSFGRLEKRLQVRVPRVFAFLFLVVSTTTIVYTHQAIVHSRESCAAYPECAAYAYRWQPDQRCPCLAYIDVDKAPRSYHEWTHPLDVTDRVKSLAASGALQVLNIINRRLAVWPDELQLCTKLRHISLIYTDVEVIPQWARTFSELEFLSIEGKLSERNLVSLPDDLFDAMSVLTHIHLGGHQQLAQLPRMDGLKNLNSLSLALISPMDTLPDLSSLITLDSVVLVWLPAIEVLPELPPHVSTFIVYISRVCCNGFFGHCRPTYAVCSDLTLSTCIQASDSARQPKPNLHALLATSSADVCYEDPGPAQVPLLVIFAPITQACVDQCGGVMYKECSLGGGEPAGRALCYNDRFQAVACTNSTNLVDLRRAEIQRGVGAPCDPKVEAWLGCSESS